MELFRNILRDITMLISADRISNRELRINIAPIAGFTNLIRLHLSDNQINDIDVLNEFVDLISLWLDGNPISEEQIAELKTKLPNTDIQSSTNDK